MTDPDASDSNLLKRKLPPTHGTFSRVQYPRKRAFVACHMCRARKTRCDNQRPICGGCIQLESTCVYPDPASDHASFDPASLAILDRLNYLVNLVEANVVSEVHQTANTEDTGHSPSRQADDDSASLLQSSTTEHRHPATIEQQSAAYGPTNNNPDDHTLPRMFYGSSEDILEWTVFQAKHGRRQIEQLIFDPPLDNETTHTYHSMPFQGTRSAFERVSVDLRTNASVGHVVREEDALQLVEIFLANVHTKNPIFETNTLRNIAKSVVGRGFGWDEESCAVLLVCALAAISNPFVRVPILDHGDNDSLNETPQYATAEAYYDAARKRIGLLTSTRLATECLFLAGVYEMYSLRPLRSSISFNRACVAFQALTWMRSENLLEEHRLEKAQLSRLYWSCLKSEHEIMVELRFPPSGLTTLNYTQSFPSPPVIALPFQAQLSTTTEDTPNSSYNVSGPEPELERAWYYYLADIAARRILQRVFDTFYKTPARAWLQQSIPRMIWAAEELDQQLTQWCLNLPKLVSFEEDVFADEELNFHLQARAAEIRERIHRPFLFIAIHRSTSNVDKDLLLPFVQKHLWGCLRLIRHWNVRHRHHGTWLMVRQSFAAGLLLVAGRRAGYEVIPSQEFRKALCICLLTLQYWEREALDLRASRLILEDAAAEYIAEE